jgi:hypothetical protein
MDEEDFVQIGLMALCRAVDKWTSCGYSVDEDAFVPYARKAIATSIASEATEAVGAVSAPRRIKQLATVVRTKMGCGEHRQHIIDQLDLTSQELVELKPFMGDTKGTDLENIAAVDTVPYDVMSDMLAPLDEDEAALLQSRFCRTASAHHSGIHRKMRSIQLKLAREGYLV